MAVGNAGGMLAAGWRRRRGDERGFSCVHFLSLTLCLVAWLLPGARVGPSLAFLPALLDPANWLLAALPVFLLRRRPSQRAAGPSSRRDAAPEAGAHPRLRDGLTGLPLLRSLELGDETPFAVLFDVDGLRMLNDHLGMAVADEALARIASALAHEGDQRGARVLRAGGDEFLAVLPASATREQALLLAHAGVRAVRELAIPHPPRARPDRPGLGVDAAVARIAGDLATRVRESLAPLGDRIASARRSDPTGCDRVLLAPDPGAAPGSDS